MVTVFVATAAAVATILGVLQIITWFENRHRRLERGDEEDPEGE